MRELKNIGVLGAGVMGSQLGLLCAEAGLNVIIRDIEEGLLDRGRGIIESHLKRRIKKGKLTEEGKQDLLAKIRFTLDVKETVKDADYVIEAVTEVMDIKHALFKEAYEHAPKYAIFGTNTSAFLIGEIAEAVPEPERMIGVHFFNPPGTMKLLEIIYGKQTGKEAVDTTDELAKLLGREVVYCLEDSPGFVTTRLLAVMVNESAWAVELDGADVLEVDAGLKYGLGLPMGMFELIDILGGGGVALQHEVGTYLGEKLGKSFGNAPIIEKKLAAGELGKDSGKGFYDWSEGRRNEVPFCKARDFDPIRILAPLVNQALRMVEEGIMTKEDIDKAMTLGLGFPRGLLRMADSVGLDKIREKVKELYDAHQEKRYECAPILERLVSEGNLGRKTRKGVYSYGPGEYELITLDLDEEKAVATLTINRPHRANSLNVDCYAEMSRALDVMESKEEIKCIVITGAGRNFCAGADISMFASGDTKDMVNLLPPIQKFLLRLETIPKTVIAAINGPCLGGGLELAISCDFRIASRGAILGFAEANLGLFPGTGGTQRTTRLIGMARTKELVLLGQSINADKALDWGLVNEVADPTEFQAAVAKMARSLCDKTSLAQGVAKRAIYYGAQADLETGIFLEGSSFPPALLSDEASEGITAFFYRRKADFGQTK